MGGQTSQGRSQFREDEIRTIVTIGELRKILYGREDESDFIIQEIDSQSPFRKFAGLLIESFNTESREAFEKIGKCYAGFLAEPSVEKLYWALGFAVFGIRNPQSNDKMLAFLE